MDWVLHESIKGKGSLPPLPLQLPVFPPPPPPPPAPPPPLAQNSLGNKISPSILLIIVILAVIFFISGLLHLLVRYLLRPTNRDPEDTDNATALQGQLQQLFHLHDAGVDQSFIDTLPVFFYKAIIGLKDPFDCAVCLCEFEADDKLRLLPKCSHAFHLECIDTWLLSHSTCPLCRRSLLPDFSPNNSCSPIVLVLESGSESSREIVPDGGESGPNTHLGFVGEDDLGPSIHDISQKPGEIRLKEEPRSAALENSEAKVIPVKLGKFRNVDVGGGGEEGTSGNSNLDQRRCFSMGYYEYVMDESSLLQVAIKPSKKKPNTKKSKHRLAMSECDCHSRREGFRGFDPSKSSAIRGDGGDARITANLQKKESFSVSKIWLRSKKEKPITEDCSRRAFSFRMPLHRQSSDKSKLNCSTSPRASELVIAGWEKSGSEMDLDVEIGSCNNSIGSLAEEAPSFTRRTLLWIVGKQNKVGNHF